MESTPTEPEKKLAQLSQKRGLTSKVALLYEDRLEIRTSTFLGEVRSALELDAIEGISHVRGANLPLTIAAASTLATFLAFGVSVLMGAATPADMRMLATLGGLTAFLVILFMVVREDSFRIETFRKGRFTLFVDHDPDTAVIEFLGAVRRTRQRFMRGRRDGSGAASVADEIRKLAGLVTESVLTPEEFVLKKRELLEMEALREFAAESGEPLDEPLEDEDPKSIN